MPFVLSEEKFGRSRDSSESSKTRRADLYGFPCETHKNTTDKNVVSIDIISPDGTPSGSMEIIVIFLILCAGSIATPELLLQSEIAPNNKAIGVGLHIHPVINTWAMLEQPIYQRGSTQGHYIDEFAEENILLEANPIIAEPFSLIGMDMKTFLKEDLIWHLQEVFFVIHQKGLYPCPKKVLHKYPMNSMKETQKTVTSLGDRCRTVVGGSTS